MIVLMAKVTYVGNTLMEIRVDTYVEDFQGTRKPINRAYLTLVAVDSNNVPRKVPAFDGFFSLPSKADCIFIRLNGVVIEVVRHLR